MSNKFGCNLQRGDNEHLWICETILRGCIYQEDMRVDHRIPENSIFRGRMAMKENEKVDGEDGKELHKGRTQEAKGRCQK